MSNQPITANTAAESYRVFEGLPHYIEGYTPSSYDSQHSSLMRSSTWIGMGLLLSSVAGLGAMVFGLGSMTVSSQEHWKLFTIVGAIFMALCIGGGAFLIHHGRRYYRQYREATGRTQ